MEAAPDSISILLDAAVTSFSALAGVMAVHSGRAARRALREGASNSVIGDQISRAIAESFDFAVLLALVALIIVLSA